MGGNLVGTGKTKGPDQDQLELSRRLTIAEYLDLKRLRLYLNQPSPTDVTYGSTAFLWVLRGARQKRALRMSAHLTTYNPRNKKENERRRIYFQLILQLILRRASSLDSNIPTLMY